MVEHFKEVWKKFDLHASNVISSGQLQDLIQVLDAPLGLGDKDQLSNIELLLIIKELDVPDHGGKLHFQETLFALARRVVTLGSGNVEIPECRAVDKLDAQRRKSAAKQGLGNLPPSEASTAEHWAANVMQTKWKQHLMRAHIESDPSLNALQRRQQGILSRIVSVMQTQSATSQQQENPAAAYSVEVSATHTHTARAHIHAHTRTHVRTVCMCVQMQVPVTALWNLSEDGVEKEGIFVHSTAHPIYKQITKQPFLFVASSKTVKRKRRSSLLAQPQPGAVGQRKGSLSALVNAAKGGNATEGEQTVTFVYDMVSCERL